MNGQKLKKNTHICKITKVRLTIALHALKNTKYILLKMQKKKNTYENF